MLTDFWHNEYVSATLDEATPERAPLAFHQRLPGYAPTPLVEAPELAQAWGIDKLWIKNESRRLNMPAFKILGASWATYCTLVELLEEHGVRLAPWQTLKELSEQLAPLRPLTLLTATDGNHGRAVARMAALLNLNAHIFMPAGTVDARVNAIESEGATVTVVSGNYDDAVALAASKADERHIVISDTSWPGYEAIPTRVIEGYSTIFWEIEDQLAAQQQPVPDLMIVQTGVGALAAAMVRQYRRPGLAVRPCIINIEPTSAACVLASLRAGERLTVPDAHGSIMAGLNCGTTSLVAWPWLQQGINACITIDDEQARQGMRDLAQLGLVAGETGAAGVAGLAAVLRGTDAPQRRELLGVHAATQALALITEGATDPAAYTQIVGASAEQVSGET